MWLAETGNEEREPLPAIILSHQCHREAKAAPGMCQQWQEFPTWGKERAEEQTEGSAPKWPVDH